MNRILKHFPLLFIFPIICTYQSKAVPIIIGSKYIPNAVDHMAGSTSESIIVTMPAIQRKCNTRSGSCKRKLERLTKVLAGGKPEYNGKRFFYAPFGINVPLKWESKSIPQICISSIPACEERVRRCSIHIQRHYMTYLPYEDVTKCASECVRKGVIC